MITFTPLSGAAHSSHTKPLCYLLQVDDVRILLDCGSPDWSPEILPDDTEHPSYHWETYCSALRASVQLSLLENHPDSRHVVDVPPQLISSFSHMVTWRTLVSIHTRTRDGV